MGGNGSSGSRARLEAEGGSRRGWGAPTEPPQLGYWSLTGSQTLAQHRFPSGSPKLKFWCTQGALLQPPPTPILPPHTWELAQGSGSPPQGLIASGGGFNFSLFPSSFTPVAPRGLGVPSQPLSTFIACPNGWGGDTHNTHASCWQN